MPIAIQPYRAEHEPAVAAFNQRLRSAGQDENLVFYRSSVARWLPRTETSKLHNELFVAVDNSSGSLVVRGGYALKTQDFLFPDRQIRSIGYYHHPLSEGLIDKSQAIVGTLLLRDAMQRAPLLYCLGMNGYDNPLPQMLIRMGWNHFAVPFLFRALRPARFLRNMETIRSSAIRRALLDAVALSGAGSMASGIFQSYQALTNRAPAATFEEVLGFGETSESIWAQAKNSCSFTAVRDSEALRQLYPPSETHLRRIIVKVGGEPVGWAVVGERREDSKYGAMRVASVVDCFATSGHYLSVVRCATEALAGKDFDLILTNQSHQDWVKAFRAAGYLPGPSNFIFAASKKLGELLAPFAETRPRMHMNRSDGDGLPKNY